MFNSVPHSTTKWSPASPKRENQSSLCTFVRLSPVCLYYLRSASLQALRRLHPPSPLPPPLSPILPANPFCRSPPFVLDLLHPTCSAPLPFSNLISPNRRVCSQQAAALRNFISCARLIIRQAFTYDAVIVLLPISTSARLRVCILLIVRKNLYDYRFQSCTFRVVDKIIRR